MYPLDYLVNTNNGKTSSDVVSDISIWTIINHAKSIINLKGEDEIKISDNHYINPQKNLEQFTLVTTILEGYGMI